MFGIDSGELLIIALVALVVIGPKDLPRAMRTIGQFVGRARGMARHFRSGIDTMIREAELEEMEKQWKANNERIMRESPASGALAPAEAGEPAPAEAGDSDWGAPAAAASTPPSPAPAPDPVPPPLSAPAPAAKSATRKTRPSARRPRPRTPGRGKGA